MSIEITFSASATVNQEIELNNGFNFTADEIVQGLETGEFFTTMSSNGVLFMLKDNELIEIGKIVDQQVENTDYFDFVITE